MSHPKNILRKFFRERVPKLLNSFMAASMLLNTLSPVFFLGDLAQNSNYLKGFRYSGAARHEKIQALGFEAPDLAADFRLDDSVAYFSLPDFADILDVPGEIALGASLQPAWMAESAAEDDLIGTDLLPVWMTSSADAPPDTGRDPGLCPPAANITMKVTAPPDAVSRGDSTGEVYTVTVTNNDAAAVPEISFQIDPNVGFYYVGGSATATSSVSGTLGIIDPGTGAPDASVIIDIAGVTPEKRLLSGETITLVFRLATNGNAKSDQQLIVALQSGSPVSTCKTTVENVSTVRGNLVIAKTPVTQDGTLGDTISWNVQLRNTGLGYVYDATFSDVIGGGYSGLSIVGPGLPLDLAPEASAIFTVESTIASCTNLTNTIDASWSIGNSDGTATVANPLEDEVDIVFLLEEPDISIQVGQLNSLNYCGTMASTVPVTVTNVGGAGRNLVLAIDTQNVDSITELSADWIKSGNTFVYQGGSPAGTILPGETLTFDMNVQVTSAACTNETVDVTLTPSFYDACMLLLDSASAGSTPNLVVTDAATLDVSKSGPSVVAAGDTFVYTVTVSGLNQDSIDAGGVMVTDTVPGVLTITNVTTTTGAYTITGNTINWHLPLAGSGAYNEEIYITVDVPEIQEGVCDAGASFTNNVEAFADICAQCTPLSANDSVTTWVEDYLGTNNSFSKTASPVELCDSGATQIITAILNIQEGITWTNTIYTDTLGQDVFALPLNVVNGSLSVEIDGVNRIGDVITSLGPPLVIDFSNIGAYSNTAAITITYQVTAAVGSISGTAASQSAFLFSEFEIGGTQNACAGGAVGYVGADYTIYRGDLNLSATPGVINTCGVSTVTINIDGSAVNSLTDNLVVTFTAQAGDVFTASVAVLGGSLFGQPVTITQASNVATFTFSSGLEIDSSGTIEFPLYRDCTVSGPISSGVVYQDRCNVVRTSGGTATSATQISDVNLFTTPNQYVVNSKSAIWRFYVSSIGQITAENLVVTNTLPLGHKFITYTVSSTSAPTNVVSMVTGTVGGQEVVTFTISSLPVGGRLKFDMQSQIDSLCNLPAQIDIALWDDCGGVNGACSGRQTGIVRLLPGPFFLLTSNDQVAALPLCQQGPVQLVVKNTSASAPEYQFNITDVITNATFVVGSAYVTVTDITGAVVTGAISSLPLANIPFAPTVTPTGLGETITWRYGDFVSGTPQYDVLIERAASDVVTIDMLLETSCTGTDAQVQSFVDALDVCTQPLSSEEDAQTLDTDIPVLQATKVGYNADTETAASADDEIFASAGETVVWEIEVTNGGDAPVTNLFVTDTVPADYNITAVSAGGSFGGGVASWGSAGGLTLNVLETKTFSITGVITGNVCALNRQNTATVNYGCSTTDICLGIPVQTNAAILKTQPEITDVVSDFTIDQCSDEIRVRIINDGPPAWNVVLTDTLPAGFVYESLTSATTAPSTLPTPGDNVITFTWTGANTIPDGNTDLIIKIRNDQTSGACSVPTPSVTNRMDIYYEDSCIAPMGTFTRTDTNSHATNLPNLVATKTPVSQVSDVGDTVTWDLYVNNTGTAAATNVVITDVVSTNFTNVSGTVSTVTGGGSNTPSLPAVNTVAWTNPITIPSGGTWHAVVTADILASGNNTDTMTAVGKCASGCVFATSNDIAYVTLLEEFNKAPEVQTDTIGASVVFTFTTSLSDQDGLYEGITLTDTLPTGLGYIAAELDYTEDGDGNNGGPTTTTGVTPTITPGLYTTGDIIWQLGDVNGTVQLSGIITAVIQNIVTTNHGDRVVNNIDLSYTQDTQYYTFTDNANVDIVEPFLNIEKDVTPLDAEPRDTAYYTITLYHAPSPAPVVSAFNVLITDIIPAELTYVLGSITQISGPAADSIDDTSPPTLNAFWSEIPITVTQADPIRLRYAATVNEDAPVGESYVNVVTTTWTSLPDNPYGETRDGDGGHGGADDYIASDPAIIGLSEVRLAKTAPISTTAGTNITYTIYVINDGPFTATSAIVTDTMPFQVSTLSAVYNVPGGNSGNCAITSGTPDVVVCSMGDILDDITATITIVALVADDTPEGADLTNVAYVTVTSPDGDDTNNDDSTDTEVYTEADNDVSKSCTSPVTAGQTVVCEVVLQNLGPSVSRDVDIKDILPAGFTWVSGTATQGTCVNGICQYGDVNVSQTITATITATVGSDVTGSFTNEAVVFSDTADPVPGNDSDTAPIVVNALTALQIAKVDLTDPVYANNTYLYEIVITNTGPSDAQNVVITDDLPAEVAFEGASPECSHSSGTVTCNLGTLAADATYDLFINVRVDSGVVSGTVGTNNTAVTTSTALDLANSTLTDSENTTYLQNFGGDTDLEITKSVSPASVVAGNGQFTYVMTVTNIGAAPANAVQVVDAFPSEFDFVSATADDGSTCNSGMTCDLGVVIVGETVVITLVVDVPTDVAAATYTNTTYVGTAGSETDYTNNQATAASAVTNNAVLQLRKIDNPSLATPGQDLEYTIVVTNTGPSDAANVTVSDPLPAGFSLDFVLSSQGGCASLPCNLGTLAPDETATIWVNGTVNANAAGTLNNTATVTSPTPGTGDNDSTATPLSGGVDLALVKTATPTVYAGETIDYLITVYNQGTADVTNATVTDTLPVSVTFDSASPGCSEASGVVTCGTFNLSAGANTSFTITVTSDDDIVPGSSLENTAIVGSPTPETDVENNQDDADTSILGEADLGLVKTGPLGVVAGETITYTLVITNDGPSTAQNVDVKDLLPNGVTFDSASTTAGFCVPGVCQLGDIGVGSIVTVVITATVGSDVTGSLVNDAQVFADTEDPNPTNDSDDATTSVTTSADVSVVKVDLVDPVATLGTLLYELVVTNDGPSDALNVVVTDTLDSNATFYNASPGCTLSGSDVVCAVGTLAAGSSVDYLISVMANTAISGTVLTNTVVVSTDTTDSNSGNDTDEITTTVVQDLGPAADLGITKSDDPISVVAGEYVTYTLTITNDGPAIATNVRVLELIPAGTTVQSVTPTNPDYIGEHCSNGGSCYLGTVFTDTVATIIVVLQVDDDYTAATIDNTASVAGDQQDPDPSDNIATETTAVTTSVDLTIQKNDLMDPVNAGENILYQITITNTGSSAAENVVITDSVPVSTTFMGASPLCVENSGLITCSVGDLSAGERASVWIQVETDSRLANGSTVNNRAYVSSDTTETDDTNNSEPEDTTVNQPSLGATDLEITKSDNPGTVIAGETLTYTLVVTNNGPAQATNVLVVDALPDGVTVVSATASQGLCNGGVTCDLINLAVGASATVTVVVNVDSDQTADLLNVARVSATNPESNDANNQANEATVVNEVADLEIIKNAPTTATPGGTIGYEITVSNNGPSDAQSVVVTDTIPTGLSGATASGSQGSCSIAAGLLTCNLGVLAIGETVTIDINADIDTDTTGDVVNTANASSPTDPTSATIDASDTATTTMQASADLALNVNSTPTANAGETVTVTYTVYNAGPSDAENVVITATFPTEVTPPVGWSLVSGTTYTYSVGTVPAGSSTNVVEVLTLNSDIEPGTSIEFPGEVGSTTADPNVDNNVDDADTSVLDEADLGLVKTGPASVVAGETIAYTLVITNAGPSTAQNVDVKDLLPNGVTFESASTTAGFCVPGVCQLGDMTTSDTVTIIITATVDSNTTGTIINEAQVFTDSEDPNPANDNDDATTTVTTSADLTVAKVDFSDPVAATAGLLYEVVVTNNGPSDAVNVTLTDTLDSAVSFVGASPGCTHSGTPTNGDVTCVLATLAAGASASYLISVDVTDVPSGTVLVNAAVVDSDTPDSDGTNNDATITTTVEDDFGPAADLGITKSDDPDTVVAGEYVTYTLTITNDGPAIATNVRVLELIPAGTTVQSVTPTNPDYIGEHCSNGGSCYLGTVFTDTVATIIVVLQVDDDYTAATINNTASVAGDQQDDDPTDNIATEVTDVITSVDLVIRKNDLMDSVYAGNMILYQITVTNTGSSAAQNVVITDSVPVSTTFKGASPLCLESGGLVTCQVGDLGAGEKASVFIQVETDERLANNSTINNTAYVSSDTTETDDTNNSDIEDTTVLQTALNPTDMEIAKGDDPDPVIAGETLTYTLVVTNNGPAPAEDVFVVDALPDGVTFVSSTASQGLCNGGVTCDLGDLVVGAIANITIVVTVDSDQTANLLNMARVSATNPESDDTNNQASEATVVNEVADLEIIKNAPTTATPGGTIGYEITVSNNGPSDAQSVVVTDTIPTGLSGATASGSQGSCSIAAGLLTCNLGVLAIGETVTIDINADIDTDTTGDVVNTANASSPTDPTSSTIDASDTATTTMQASADLALNVNSTPTANAGETVTVTYTVYNAGPSDAENVVITATFPTEVTPPVGWSLVSGTTYTYSVGTVPAGSSTSVVEVLTLNSDIEPGTSIEFPGEVGATTADPNVDNNVDDADTSILDEADLGLVKTGPVSVIAGETITYTLVITNDGPSTAQNVDVKDLLPNGVTFESASTTAGFCVPGVCQLGDMTTSDTVTIIITATVDSDVTGSIVNEAQVFSDSEDPNLANNNDDATTTVTTSADLTVAKVDFSDPVAATAGLLYEVVVTNNGPSNAVNVILTDTLDSAVSFVGASPGCTHSGTPTNGDVTCVLATLAAGASASYLISVDVTDVPSGTVLVNAAVVDSDTPDSDGTNNDATITTTVEDDFGPAADLGITKSDDPDTVIAGELVTYTLTITNDGPAIATNVRVLELIPAGTTVQSVTPTNPDYIGEHCSNGGSCYLGTVFTDTVATIVVVLQVDDDYTAATINNTASVAGDQQDSDPSDNIATETTDVTTSVDLVIQKNDLMDSVYAGNMILYQITVTNTGSSAAQNVVITDSVPVSTTFKGASPLCVESAGLVTCQVGDLGAGEKASVFIQVETDERLANNSTINNTAYVSSDTTETDDTNNSDPEDTTVLQTALNPTDMEIAKGDDPDPVIAGETLTYTLVVTNNGPAPAEDVFVVDALPDGTTFVSSTASQGLCNGGVTCDLGDLAVGATANITIVVTVDSDQTANLLNMARVSATNPESNDTNNQASEATVVNEVADLEIIKNAPTTATPGGTIAYQIMIWNDGPSDAQNVQVNDYIPGGLSNVVPTASQGSCSIVLTQVVCNVGELAVGDTTTVDINATIDTDATGDLVNIATASSPTDPTDPNIDASDVATTTLAASADLALNVNSTPTVIAGETVTVTYTVYNAGPSDAENVVITATFPTEVTSAAGWSTPSGWTLVSGNVYEYAVGSLAAGGSQVVTVNLPVDDDIEPGTSIEFPGEVGSTTADPNVDNNVDDADTSVIGEADLGLTKTGPASVVAGETIAYTLVITNDGPSTARSVDVKDFLPNGVTFESASTTQGFCVPGICQLGDVVIGDTVTIVITATVDSDTTGSIINEAQVFTDSADPNPLNDNDDATTIVTTSADLSVVKVDLMDPVEPGKTLIYELVVTNVGPSDAVNVTITDTLPLSVTFVNASPNCTEINGEVICTLTNIAAGTTVDYLIAVDVNAAVVSGTLLTNAVEVDSDTSDPDTNNNTDSITTLVEQDLGLVADLGITKSDDPDTVVAGELVTYTLTITNDGPAIATNVRVLELIPAGTTVQSISPDNPDFVGEHCSNGGSCYLGTVFTDTVATIIVVLQVDDDYTAATINNTASVAGDQQDDDPTDNIATEVTDVITSVDLVIRKNDLMDTVYAGNMILYQITVTNTGSSAAQNVVITDSVPVSTTFKGASPLCVESAGLVTCQVGDLGAGEKASVFIQVETDERLANNSTINNIAYVSSDTTETDDTNNSDPEDTTVLQTALNPTDMVIAKSDTPDPVIAGETLTYTIVVTNSGPAPAEDVFVIDALPAGVTFDSATPTQGLCNAGITCDLGDLAVGDSVEIIVVVTVDSDQTAPLLNVVRVSASNPEIDDNNNEASEPTAVNEVADIDISKSAPSSATPGGQIDYQITVWNNGPSDAQDVDVLDILPTDLSNVSASSSQGTCSESLGLLNCALGAIAVGESVVIDIHADINADAIGELENRVYASSPTDPTSPNGYDTTDTVTTTLEASADLALSKSASATVVAGEMVSYQLAVYNAGPSDAEDVTITDTLPVSVSFSAATIGCTETNGVVECGPFDLAAGDTETYTITALVDSDVEQGTSLENTARVDATTADPNTFNDVDDADTSILARAELGLVKAGPATATAGEMVTYTIVLTNAGPSTARSVDIKDILPDGFSLESAATTQGQCVSAICQLGDVAVGDTVTVTVVATVDSDTPQGTYTNTAQVFSGTTDDIPANNVDDAQTVVDTEALLIITKQDLLDPVDIGSDLTYQIVVENQGPSDAQNVIVTDTLPTEVDFQASTDSCIESPNGILTCDLGTIVAGDTESFLVTVVVTDSIISGTVIVNDVALTATTTLLPASVLTDTEDTTVVQDLGNPADLQLRKDAPATVIAGETLTYTIVVTNAGTAIATNTSLVDALPNGVDFVSATASNGGLCNAGIYCDLDTIEVDEVVTVTVVVDVQTDQADNTLHNVALVNADQPDETPGDATDSADTLVEGLADIYIEKSASRALAVTGQDLIYTLLVGNRGPSDAENVTVTDTLPVSFTLTTVTSSQGNCATLPCNLGTLQPDDTATVTLIGTIDASATQDLVNTAYVSSTTPVTNTVDDEDTITTSIRTIADVGITKAVNAGIVDAGGLITYTLTVQNYGPSTAQNVQVSDAVPAGTTFVTATLPYAGPDPLTWSLGNLAVGEVLSLTVVVQSAATLPDGYLINNIANVTTDSEDTNASNNTDNAWIQSFRSADLEIEKSALSSTVVAGETTFFTITLYNQGPAVSSDVDVKELAPAGLTVENIETSQGFCTSDTCQLGTVLEDTTVVITVEATVDADVISGTVLCNQTAVFADTIDPNGTNDDDDACLTVEAEADLSIDKVAPVLPTEAGGTFFYTINVENVGPSDAQNVVVTDDLPAEVTFVGATPTQTSGPNPLVWNLGTLAAGESTQIQLQVTVNSWVSQTYTNTIVIDSSTPDPNPSDNIDEEPADVSPKADLELFKEATDTTAAGSLITYTLMVYNHGPSVAENVVVTDVLHADVVFASASAGCSHFIGVVNCGPVNLDPDTAITYTLVVTAAEGLETGISIENVASVGSSTEDPNPVNNDDDADTSIIEMVDLSIVKTDSPDSVIAGETLTYTLTAYNAGPSVAQNVTVYDWLPDEVTFVSASPTKSGGLNPVLWLLESLAVGETQVFTVVVTVNSDISGTISNRGEIRSTSPEANPVNNIDDEPTTVETLADISITKVGDPDPNVIAGENLTYTLEIHNAGPSDAQNVVITDTLPADVTYLSSDLTPVSTSPLSWDLGTLPSGVTQTIKLVVTVDPAATGLFYNFANVSSSTPDPALSNNVDNEETTITPRADLSIVKTATPVLAVGGEILLYELTVTNNGPSTAVDVVVTDTLPGDVTYNESIPLPIPSTSYAWYLGDLEPGMTATVEIDVVVDVAAFGTLENMAVVDSVTVDPNPGDNETSLTTSIGGEADLAIAKVDDADPVAIESLLTYYITVTNYGPNTAVNVVMTDTLPSDVTYVEAYPPPNSAPYPMIWNLGTMLPNETRLITLTVWVEPWAAAIFTNTVNASSQTADPDPNNLVDTEPTAVGNPTAVTIVSFNAIQSEGYDVDIAWDVASGLGVYAFKVYRTTTNSFDNPDYITSIAWDRARVYTAQDTVPAYGQYWYWLTEHSTSGAEGPPVSSTTITVGPRYKIYLPLVLR